jgi:hypothetical protein
MQPQMRRDKSEHGLVLGVVSAHAAASRTTRSAVIASSGVSRLQKDPSGR